VTPFAALSAKWRIDAELLASYGAEALANVARRHANELERAVREMGDDALDLATAAQESGYSRDRLRHMIASGELPNAGKRGAPRIRRGDLPIKRRSTGAGFNADATAQHLLRRGSGA
jgi:hypothetical protein